jgi:hypothetical protein
MGKCLLVAIIDRIGQEARSQNKEEKKMKRLSGEIDIGRSYHQLITRK